jgi:hypothetical protein
MMSKTSELAGAALDWAVAKCERRSYLTMDGLHDYAASTDWSQGGPIIEREGVTITMRYGEGTGGNGRWAASIGPYPTKQVTGPTPLIAAMRCFVASRLGDEVDVPEELLK